MTTKILQRWILDNRLWRKKKFFCLLALILIFIWKDAIYVNIKCNTNSDSFDVVYTWVNGSDVAWSKLVQLYKPFYDPSRFDDKNELKYSLRSLQKFAPWVNHVFIITNGQIPHWLNLNYHKVTLVQHSELVPNTSVLPTFSSSAIETFIHRIPTLTKRFLYLNDDIFLGAPLYPEDLYTPSEGVKIYNAWSLPDCAADCPWVYIGDGSCDQHCNIQECQFDGGDCAYEDVQRSTEFQEHVIDAPVYEIKKVPINDTLKENKKPRRHLHKRYRNSFNDLIKKENLSSDGDLRKFVEKFNKEQKLRTKPHHHELVEEKTPFENTRGVYTKSLLHTNMILNRIYGFKSRNVLAHVGFLLEKNIIDEMQKKFQKDIEITMSHRFRDPTDLQYSFLYYNFLISEARNASVAEIFDEFDTDNSTSWSDREIRTLLARLYPLPLDWAVVRYFEEVVTNCSKDFDLPAGREPFTTLVYERYEDSNIPSVSKSLVMNCPLLAETLIANFAKRPKYKFSINQKRGMHSNFVMLRSNVTEVVDSLDKLRRNLKKFNCINDDLEPQFLEENELVRYILEDFYLSFFPERSDFELPEHYRNRFAYLDDYNKWKSEKRVTLFIGYILSTLLLGVFFRFCCFHKAKFARRYIPLKCCDI